MQPAERIEKRANYRHRYVAETTYDSGEGTIGRGEIRDISLGGAFITAERIIPVGNEILITVPTPKSTRFVSLRGTVERISDDGFAISFKHENRQDAVTGG